MILQPAVCFIWYSTINEIFELICKRPHKKTVGAGCTKTEYRLNLQASLDDKLTKSSTNQNQYKKFE